MSSSLQQGLRWGIVGCGNVCEVKSGPAFYKCENSSLVAVMRRQIDKAKDFADRHNVPRYYGTAKELIMDENVDCVYVATPPGGDRVDIARAIVKAGKPCYMEKPLGRDAVEATEIALLFEKANLPLYVAYYRRAMPKFKVVKNILKDGKTLGQLSSVTVTLSLPRIEDDKSHWHYNRSISGGGLLLDVGCHMLDLVDYMIGPITDCNGIAAQTVSDQGWIEEGQQRIEDNVRGFWIHSLSKLKQEEGDDVETENYKVLGSCSFNFCSGGKRIDQIDIVGTNGSISFSCFNTDPPILSTRRREEHQQQKEEYLTMEAEDHPTHVHQPMVQAIVNELLVGGENDDGGISSSITNQQDTCLCTGSVGVRTSQVMDKLLNGRKSWKDDYV